MPQGLDHGLLTQSIIIQNMRVFLNYVCDHNYRMCYLFLMYKYRGCLGNYMEKLASQLGWRENYIVSFQCRVEVYIETF